jgi:hypothetical protein
VTTTGPEPPDEVYLPGAIGVVRVGATVRKVAGPWTPTIHALLTHLDGAGFDLAPRPLGVDDRGREILSWIDGEPGDRPWPPPLLSAEGVVMLASTLRRYHDAVRGFDPGPHACWRSGRRRVGPNEVVCHGDLGPWNTVWRKGSLVGVIDWDMAEPGPPMLDLAFLALHLVPLRSDRRARQAGFAGEPPRAERLLLLCETYGGVRPADVLAAVEAFHERDRVRTVEWGRQGREPWATFLRTGDLDTIAEDREWIQAAAGALGRAIRSAP